MKTILKILFVATLTVFFINQGYSQTTAKSASDNATTGTTVQGNFVDKNNDGVCDNIAAKGNTGRCANFVDKDGNGVCDNRGTTDNCCKAAGSQGKAHHNRQDCGQGPSNCGNHGSPQGKCCPNQKGSANPAPSVTPDPKK